MTKAEGANLISGPVSGTTGINGDITLTGTLCQASPTARTFSSR
jgi:hypothetical protein